MTAWKVDDIPEPVRSKVKAALAKARQTRQDASEPAPVPTQGGKAAKQTSRTACSKMVCYHDRPPNRTELEAENELRDMGLVIIGRQVRYGLSTGACYTADIVARNAAVTRVYIIEVKGPYRHASAGRSRVAWLQTCREYGARGIWLKKRSAGRGWPEHWEHKVGG